MAYGCSIKLGRTQYSNMRIVQHHNTGIVYKEIRVHPPIYLINNNYSHSSIAIRSTTTQGPDSPGPHHAITNNTPVDAAIIDDVGRFIRWP